MKYLFGSKILSNNATQCKQATQPKIGMIIVLSTAISSLISGCGCGYQTGNLATKIIFISFSTPCS